MTDWVRLWHDMPTDPKWRVIAKRSGRSISEVIAVFTFIMVNASANATERGRTHNLFAEDIAAALDIDETHVQAILAAMEGKVISNGLLSGWERRQPKREDNSASRAKEWREKQRAERNRTQPNATERPETETETETDILEAKASCASGDAHALKPEHFVEAWNTLASRIAKPKVRSLTPERRVAVKARINGYTLDDFHEVLSNIETSPFLRGDKGWTGCTFDWVTKKANFQKILEGNYSG